MKKQTILYILLAFLVITNGFFLVHYIGKRSHKGHRSDSFIVKELKFDKNQEQEFKSIKTLHFDKVKSITKEMGRLKIAMYSKLSDENVSQSFLDSISGLIALQEQKRDLEMFNHFQNVRKICNDEQKEKLTAIIKNAIKRRSKRGKSHKRN